MSKNDYDKSFDKFAKIEAGVTVIGAAVGAGAKAVETFNRKRAEKIIGKAKASYDVVKERHNLASVEAQKKLLEVVRLKRQIMCKNIKLFVRSYKRLTPNIKLTSVSISENLPNQVIEQKKLPAITREIRAYRSFNENRLGEQACEVVLAMVNEGTIQDLTYNITDLIKTSKIMDDDEKRAKYDELKIQSVDVLKEFGIIAVAFAMGSISDAINSGMELNHAKEIAAQLDYEAQQMELDIVKLNAISDLADIYFGLLLRYSLIVDEYVQQTHCIIKSKDNFFHIGRIKEDKFTDEEIGIMAFTMNLVSAVKNFINIPIISKEGTAYDYDFDGESTLIDQYECKRIALCE